MKILGVLALLALTAVAARSQSPLGVYNPSTLYPFGRPNPGAPPQILDFDPMIGICDCRSVQRNPDGTWQDTLAMVWQFKYIMNGNAVQDETWIANGRTATSIRRFQADSLRWIVSYYGSGTVTNAAGIWMGSKKGSTIVLKMPQKSPGGQDGINRLTFFEISEKGFQWKGEWIDPNETIIYPFWSIECWKRM